MLTARSILSLRATSTATQCSAALPTIATTIAPTKNSVRPIDSAASEIEPTRISDITPTAMPAIASAADRSAHAPRLAVLVLVVRPGGLKRSLWVRSEKTSPAT